MRAAAGRISTTLYGNLTTSKRARISGGCRRTANDSAGEKVSGGGHGANCEPADHRESTSDHHRHSY